MINLHVYPSPISNESRIEREVATLHKFRIFDDIEVAGVQAAGLPAEGTIGGATVRRFATEANSHSLRSRVGKTLGFGRAVWEHYRSQPLAVINCHSVAALPACIALKRATGAVLVYDTHELETESTMAVGKRRPIYKLIERLGIRSVDHTFTVSKSIEDWYRRRYGITAIDTIYNFPSDSQSAGSSADRRYLRDHFGIDDGVTIYLYQGVLGRGRGLDIALDAFRDNMLPESALVIVGYGTLEPEVRQAAATLDNIHFHPAVSPTELPRITCSADVGVVLTSGEGCLSYYYSAPNKMFQYWRSFIPVIASDLPEHRRFLAHYPAGAVAVDESPSAFRQAAHLLASQDHEHLASALARANEDLRWEKYEDLLHQRYGTFVTQSGVG